MNYSNYKDKEEYIEKLAAKMNGKSEDFKITGEDKAGSDVKTEYRLVKEVNWGDEFIYITPMINLLFSDNPFKKEDRKFPVNFDYLETYKQMVNITIPEGYAVEELPASQKYVFGDDNAITFSYRIVQNESTILLQYGFQTKELMIGQDLYPGLRDFFSKIILKNSEQIVLKKIAQ